jgi:hypothetical protein
MNPEHYFSIIYVLKCAEAGETPVKQSFFPAEYLTPEGDKVQTAKVKSRRSMFYKRIKKNFRLVRDDNGVIIALEIRKMHQHILSFTNESGNCTSIDVLIFLNCTYSIKLIF